MWQASNPTLDMLPSTVGVGATFAHTPASGEKYDLQTALYPFQHPTTNAYWTSADSETVNPMWTYGYGYPEVPCSYTGTAEQLDAFTTSKINTLYQSLNVPNKAKRTPGDRTLTKWNANIVIDQSELIGSFSIYVFMGQPPSDTSQWDIADQKVGNLAIFGMVGRRMDSGLATASIGLTAVLQQKGISGTEEEIEAYLTENLVWKCYQNGQDIDITTLTTLKVGVTSNTVIVPSDMTKKPKYGSPRLRTGITHGKKGGATAPSQISRPKLKGGQDTDAPGLIGNVTVASNATSPSGVSSVTPEPSSEPSAEPTSQPSAESSAGPSAEPSTEPSAQPSSKPEEPAGYKRDHVSLLEYM
ncbi:Tyrosinase [Arthrobotrys entomopaga]|nr:Tyrosinase [Arthrobotrys entomopaga]